MGISWTSHGSFKNAFAFLYYLKHRTYLDLIDIYAQKGVDALREATPKDTGLTAASWQYKIERGMNTTTIAWENTNVTRDGDCIAIMLRVGHGTGTGGYVKGRDYITPALEPVFSDILSGIEKAVKSA